MNQRPLDTEGQKEVIAASKAYYRGFEIMETANGCSLILKEKQYDFVDLSEASAFIDALYASAARRVTN